ncbi:MAG: MBL fold metallo-hydrolase [Oscillospiraceae bacterium]|nr:MBL fold metallo-hydrolase [Oscillospiraceae bacterium]
MRITYIGHSGFAAEWEDIVCLFDFAEGELPRIEADRRLFVFVSHVHSDHFSPEIFHSFDGVARKTFILSDDIPADTEREKGLTVLRMGPDRRRVLNGGAAGAVSVSTLGSTDCGVAWVVSYAGRTIYHAGDLHWWAWPGDTPAEEREMKNEFFAQIAKLKGLKLDAAFLPLDPRLKGNFWMGFDALMRTAHIARAFPMHMWGKYEITDTLAGMDVSEPYRERIARIEAPGQVFEL